jgi:hypothetical protein
MVEQILDPTKKEKEFFTCPRLKRLDIIFLKTFLERKI